MDTNKPIPMAVLFSIVDRGRGNKLSKVYDDQQLFFHTHCVGEGTATSKMIDMLGLDIQEKDILVSIGTKQLVDCIMQDLNNTKREELVDSGGIIFSITLNAINSLVAAAVKETVNLENLCGVEYMAQESSNSLIIVMVNQGYTDEMMETARGAGAVGGTIVKGRFSDGSHLEQFYGITIQEEREMVFILTSNAKRNAIIEAINEQHGLTSEAKGIIFSVPVDKAVKIS